MRVLTWDGLSVVPPSLQKHVVAIGNFDGVHRGHAALLHQLSELKNRRQCPALVITFDPPPNAILRPESLAEPLTTIRERVQLISRHQSIDAVLILQTSQQLLELTAQVFWNELLCRQLQIQGLVEGKNFRFGKDRAGNVSLLSHWADEKGIDFEVVADVYRHGVQVSSSMIRQALSRGDVAAAREGLGRCYSLSGIVVHGEHRGRSIGFPTCNLNEIATLVPRDGVYAALALVGNQILTAAVHIGPNSTFGETARTVEAHLLDFSGDLYGRSIRLDFLARLRETVRFDSLPELQKQLRLDVEQARQIGQLAMMEAGHV